MRAIQLVAFSIAILGGFVLPSPASTEKPPIYYQYFEGEWESLPDYNLEKPIDYGFVYDFTLDVRYRDDLFGVRYLTCLIIYEAGYYDFYLNSDDGSRLYIEHNLVVDNDGLHSAVERSGRIWLEPGEYLMKLDYFDAYSDHVLALNWSHSGHEYCPIPPSHLKCPPEHLLPGYKPKEDPKPSCPDLCIGRNGNNLIGGGVINSSGRNQSVSRTLRSGQVCYTAVLKNLGPKASSFRLRGLRRDKGRCFRIKYFDLSNGRIDVTGAVAAGSYYTSELEPGGKHTFEICVRPTRRAKFAKKHLSVWFDAYSSDGRCSDRVVAKVKKVPEPRKKKKSVPSKFKKY